MNMRTFLLTSAAGVGFFISASTLPQAFAQKGTFLSPASSWAVTKVAGNPAAGQAGYCAVAKRYEGNAILTIARNQGTETSFALDLQRSAFTPGQMMRVVLDPGAGQQRDYSITPASEQAFVVRLGRDDTFFNAIDRTGLLRVEVANNSFVFNISDIGSGQSKLNACLASNIESAAGDETVTFGTKVESSGNQAMISQLKSRIEALESQNGALKGEINKIETQPLIASKSTTAPVSSEALRLETLRADNLRLKAELQAGEVALRNDRVGELEAHNARLRQQLSNTEQLQQEVSSLQRRVDSLLSENASLKQSRADVSQNGEQISALENDIERLESENQSLKLALVENTEAAGVNEQLRMQIASIENENRTLKGQTDDLKKQLDTQSIDQDVQAIYAQHAKEVAALQSKLKDLRFAQTSFVQENKKIEILNGQLANLRADNLLLQQELHEKSLAQVDAVSNDVEVAALEAENGTLKELLGKQKAEDDLQQNRIADLEIENAALKKQVQSFDMASVDAMSKKVSELEKALQENVDQQQEQILKLSSLESENESLRQSLNEAVNENIALANVSDDTEMLKKEIALKDAQLAEYKDVPDKLQTLLDGYKTVQAEKDALRAENEKLENSRETNSELVARLEKAEAENAKLEAGIGDLQGEVSAMNALNDEVKTLKLTLADKEKQLQELTALEMQLAAVVNENERLREDAVKLAIMRANGEEADEALKEENVALRESLSSVMAKVEGQDAVIKEKDDSIAAALAENEALESQLELASQLIHQNETAMKVAEVSEGDVASSFVAEEPVVKPQVKPALQGEARVILASANPPESVKPMPVKSKTAEKKAVQDDASFAETLAQIAPAAGPENDLVEEDLSQSNDVVESSEIVEEAQDFMERDLNQAQIYEEQLKRSLENQDRISDSRDVPIDVEALEDPVAPKNEIDAVIENVAASQDGTPAELEQLEEASEEMFAEDVIDDAVNDAKAFTAQKSNVEDREVLSAAHDETTIEDVEMKMSQDPFEGIEVSRDGEAEFIAADANGFDGNDVDALPKAVKQPKSAPVSVDEQPVLQASFSGEDSVQRVLSMANVSGLTHVSTVASKEGAYQWRAGSLFGSGEQKTMVSAAQFDEFVKEYLSKTEARCPGDFAILPDNSKESGAMRVDSYEIACVGENVSSSASLVFYNEGDTFTVLAHETKAEDMEEAMAVRDQIFSSLASGRDS